MLLFFIACLCYLSGLDSLYLPSNGDEMVYARIARLTAAAQQWLPLVSDLDHMRNTKPPLLFWQAMVAGDWGQHWSLLRLRLPAVLYSLALASLCGLAAWRLSGQRATGWLAGAVYLAFFGSFRYGRPYLTSAAETFWLCLPWLALLVAGRGAAAGRLPGLGLSTLIGLSWGLGLAYKSFALVAPTATGWALMLLILQQSTLRGQGLGPGSSLVAAGGDRLQQLLRIGWSVAWSAGVALALFGLWFVLDPDPAAVWQEFVVGENAGKLAREPWGQRVAGMLVQALAPLENAGPLALPVLGLGWWGLRALRRRAAQDDAPAADATAAGLGLQHGWSRALTAWVVVWMLVFCIPSQRSARYILPAMPALAVLLSLAWCRLARGWFVASVLLSLPPLLLLARIAWALQTLGVASAAESGLALGVAALAVAVALAGLLRPDWTRGAALASALGLYALLNATLAPLNGSAGQFQPAPALAVRTRLAVPSTFNAQYERFQFLLPQAPTLQIQAYLPVAPAASAAAQAQLQALLATHDAVVWQHGEAPACAQAPQPSCVVLAARADLKSRHQPGEIRLGNLFQPEQWLLRREWLLRRLTP